MAWKPLTHQEAVPIYQRRSDLWIEGFTLVRIRVAIQIVRREFKRRPYGQRPHAFGLWMLKWLDEQRQRGQPHPLQWELIRCVKDMMEGSSGEMVYAEVMRTKGGRAIHKVKYGGRRDR